jgi:adenylate cyclase class IV
MITKKKKKMKKEIEVKIELTQEEFNTITGSLSGFHLERTFGYFKENFSNIKKGIFPRIKYIEGQNKEIILTVKRKTKDNAHFFEREEMEVKIQEGEDVEILREILKSLGFNKEIIFEKKRKNVLKDDIIISFDELPFGFFVEFEGEPEAINKYLNEFNLSDRPRITRAYLGLWEDYRKTHNVAEENCVFKH